MYTSDAGGEMYTPARIGHHENSLGGGGGGGGGVFWCYSTNDDQIANKFCTCFESAMFHVHNFVPIVTWKCGWEQNEIVIEYAVLLSRSVLLLRAS